MMSEEKQDSLKITTVKQKNPGRVEAGKQLAAVSREANP